MTSTGDMALRLAARMAGRTGSATISGAGKSCLFAEREPSCVMPPEAQVVQPSRNARDWHRPACYGCGPDNPHGLHADFSFHEATGEVRFEYNPQGFEIGAPGFVHGGVLASVMDEAQGVLCFHVGHVVMTDQLRMKYHRATSLDSPFQVRCWITAVRRRRMYTRGTIMATDGSLLVSSSAVWYLLPERLTRRLFYSVGSENEAARIRGVLEANRKRAREIRKRLRVT